MRSRASGDCVRGFYGGAGVTFVNRAGNEGLMDGCGASNLE